MSIDSVYLRLCTTSVFGGVLKKPLFEKFFKYAEAKSYEKIKAYGEFVAEIYEQGANLTDAVRNIVFEDENVYVKSISLKKHIPENIENAVVNELENFGAFASLCIKDFKLDIKSKVGVDISALPSFESDKIDLRGEYKKRISNIEKYGYGIFASRAMFSLSDTGEIEPIESADKIQLDNFIGYSDERQKVYDNTEAFLMGKPAANVLLYGDAGTGKSSSVKAIVNHFFDEGLRLIEIRKNQLLLLPKVMAKISKNPLKFIIFIDDLSFNVNDDNFSMLKAALEGSAASKAENAVIYATSNRRHIIKESFGDRDGDDVHRNDTIAETLSLSERFGLVVFFSKPEKKLYLEIVHALAKRFNIDMPVEQLDVDAEAFALKRGYRSARCAEQFIKSLI